MDTLPDELKGKAFSRDMAHCHSYLSERWPHLLDIFRATTGRDLFITCTWRSPEEQARLYAQGRTAPGRIVTWVDGVLKKSNHNYYPSRAFDVAVDVNPDESKVSISWDDEAYRDLPGLCQLLGLESGGAWKKVDLPHVQIPSWVKI